MKHIALLFILFTMLSSLSAYQDSYYSLATPTQLFKGEGEVNLVHRFNGEVAKDPLDTFFGLDDGANVMMGFRYVVVNATELKASYIRNGKEMNLGLGRRLTPDSFPLQAQLDINYLSFKPVSVNDRRANLSYILALQTGKIHPVLNLNCNLGYDGYYERFVNGLGLQFNIKESLHLVGEYYPVWDRNSAKEAVKKHLDDNDVFAFGIKADTYGHHFMFQLSNGSRMNPCGQSRGTDNNKLHLGFNIQRRFGE